MAIATNRQGRPGTGALRLSATPAHALRRWFRMDRKVKRRLVPVISVIVFLVLWQWVGSSVNPILLSTPGSVAASAVNITRDGVLGPAFLRALGVLFAGFGISVIGGIAIGVLMGRNETVYRAINPYVSFFQATPLIALTPLVVIWTGIGFIAEVTITCLLAIWTIIINTCEGTRNTPNTLLDMAKVYHATELQVIRQVTLPNALPYIFAGLRIALGKALIGVVIGEMSVSLKGLGGLIQEYGNSFQTAPLLAAIICSSIVGVIGTVVIELIRRRIAPWSTGGNVHTRL
jgi:ABC-type nitrate/sulfonate/bicarbonate transport system permease component